MKTPIIVSISNHKGGVGKTALTGNLSAYLLNYFGKIFVIDMDPQGNVSDILFKNSNAINTRVSDLMKFAVFNNVDFSKRNEKRDEFDELAASAIVETVYEGKKLSFITSSLDLTRVKIELTARESVANFKIKEMISHITRDYDLVIIDTPPSIELLTFSSIAASDYVIIPIQLEAHAVKGAMDIVNDIMPLVRQYYNPRCQVLGVVINTHEGHTKIGRMALPKIEELFGNTIFNTKISRSVRVGELSLMKATLDQVSTGTKSDKEFRALALEVYRRIKEDQEGG